MIFRFNSQGKIDMFPDNSNQIGYKISGIIKSLKLIIPEIQIFLYHYLL
jgi:hypothetical protein